MPGELLFFRLFIYSSWPSLIKYKSISAFYISAANQVIAYLYNTQFLALKYRGSYIQASKTFLTAIDAIFTNTYN
jgi:hypothetical protein